MTSKAALLVLASCSAMFACKRDTAITYEWVELPGFRLEAPKLDSMVKQTSEYGAGVIKRGRKSRPVVVAGVSWQPGTLSTEDEMTAIVNLMSEALGQKGAKPQVRSQRQETISGKPAIHVTVDMVGTPLTMELIETTCGARSITITVGAEKEADIIASRMAASLECKADPAKDAELAGGGNPVGFDGGLDGWARVDGDVFAITDGNAYVLFAAVPDAQSASGIGIETVMTSIAKSFITNYEKRTTEAATRHGNTRTLVHGAGVTEGEAVQVTMTMWTCGPMPGVIGMAVLAPEAPREAAIDVLMRARCAKPGEKPPELPKAEADVNEPTAEPPTP